MRRTKRRAAETQAAILEAAEAQFAERGFDQTTLESIAVAANVTRGAVYWHFENKPAILDAIFQTDNAPLAKIVANLSNALEGDPITELEAFVMETLRKYQSDPQKRTLFRIYKMVLWTGSSNKNMPAAIEASLCEIREHIEALMREAARRGTLRPPWTPELAALAFHAMAGGLLSEWARDTEAFDICERGSGAVRALLSSFRQEA